MTRGTTWEGVEVTKMKSVPYVVLLEIGIGPALVLEIGIGPALVLATSTLVPPGQELKRT